MMEFQPARFRDRRSTLKFWLRALFLLLLVLPQFGCNFFILAAYLIGGPPSIEPDFDKMTGKSLSDKKRLVLVLCYAPMEIKWDFESVDRELAVHVTHRLNQNHIRMINPDAVQGWLDQNEDWDKPEEIGAYFNVDYVVFIEMNKFTLYEENSSSLYRGQSDLVVSVIEMDKSEKDGDKSEGEVIYTKEVASRYPTLLPVSTADQTFYNFKRLYMSELSNEVGKLFYEQFAGDDIGSGGL
jgi:hypothetical protein